MLLRRRMTPRRLARLVERMWREGRMQPATGYPRDDDDGLGGVREPRRPIAPTGSASAELAEP